MKHFFSLILLSLLALFSTAQQVTISGKITNYSGSDSLTLQVYSKEIPIEKKIAISKKGTFSYSYDETSTNFCKLYFEHPDEIVLFLSANEKVTITADYGQLKSTAIIKGSRETESLQKNIRLINSYVTESENLRKIYESRADSLEKSKQEAVAQFIKNNPYNLSNLSFVSLLNLDTYSDVYQFLDSSLIKAYPDNFLVADFHSNIQKVLTLREGSTIPDIILSDVQGNTIKLSSLRGKVVLVDFWASWCRPCRMEIPNFKRLYNTYHDSNFDIYSVSIDNNTDAWKKALASENMAWANVIDDKSIYSSMFNVSSIPFTILINANGQIIAKGLRGNELEQKIKESLKSINNK